MREILFRAKRIDTGEWIEGSLIHQTMFYGDPVDRYHILYDGEFHADYYGSAEVIPETIGQFTGLLDKNGKKIFEGDVVTCNISYEMGGYPYCARITSPVIYNYGIFKPLHRCDDYSVEVIGNIYDNPELLEVKK